ncbi:hypothetical protein M885DRAFT_627105, partial [Pelagophyceae sp. CCMP2097]
MEGALQVPGSGQDLPGVGQAVVRRAAFSVREAGVGNTAALLIIDARDDVPTKVVKVTLKIATHGIRLLWLFIAMWLVLGFIMVRLLAALPLCGRRERAAGLCAYPRLPLRSADGGAARVDFFVVASLAADPHDVDWALAYHAWRNVSALDTLEVDVKIAVPAEVRERSAPLTAHFFARAAAGEGAPDTADCLGSVALTAARRVAIRKARHLLTPDVEGETAGGVRPHWRFGNERLVVRLLDVDGDGALSRAALREGLPTMGVDRLDAVTGPAGRVEYAAVAMVDANGVQVRRAAPMSPDPAHAAPTLRLKLVAVGSVHFGLRAMVVTQLFDFANAMLSADDIDELRWEVSDARVFRSAATQAVTVLHASLEYLAFREEMGAFVGREVFRGVSTSTVLWGFGRSAIIFLYLLDQEASALVLLGLAVALFTNFFKVS